MHYAVHGHTAAELIIDRADAQKEHMGLTTWENAPDGKIVKPDVSVAKNYLKGNELEAMGRIVNSFLDERSRLNTPKSLLKPNLKSIVSFKTACLSPTSTNWMTEICLHLILYQRIHNPNWLLRIRAPCIFSTITLRRMELHLVMPSLSRHLCG